MNTQEYIDSGILELYVYGNLNAEEMEAVSSMAQQHPEINHEIRAIEHALSLLSSSVSPKLSGKNYEVIKNHLFSDSTPTPRTEKAKTKRANYWGWVVALALAAGGYYFLDQKEAAYAKQLLLLELEKLHWKNTSAALELSNAEKQTVLTLIRDPKNIIVPLYGQDAAPKSYATLYWNKETKKVYVDGLGLPTPPEGMIYQVWSLQFNPLKPEAIGLIENFRTSKMHFFTMETVQNSEAFGITLEPAGGSATPTLEQLFTLGKR